MSLGRKHRRPAEQPLPPTLEAAVTFLIQNTPADELETLRKIPESQVGLSTRVWQMGIRNRLGLWGKNRELINSLNEKHRWADSASDLIVMTLWRRLQLPSEDIHQPMYRAELHGSVAQPWATMEPIRVGRLPTGLGTPGVYVTVERHGIPFARIDVWPCGAGPFSQVIAWKNLIVVGWNDRVHLVDPLARHAYDIECEGYFGQVYPDHDCLLIADATHLICVDDRGGPLWESPAVAIDGVVIEDMQDGQIDGQGEWDPPGGWRPFRISRVTGQPLPG